MYTIIWIAGTRDEEELGTALDFRSAELFAEKFYAEHSDEFDECFGGIGIVNEKGEVEVW